MSHREMIALGTGSQVPSRERNHNAYLLRWDGEGFLFDPGEGTQRQLTLAGISSSSIHHICITHFHGDHCLGLTGIVQRLSLDGCEHSVHLFYPESGQPYIDRLCSAAIYQLKVELIYHPVPNSEGMLELKRTEDYVLMACSLEHTVPTIGFRIEEPPGFRFIPERLNQFGVSGPMVGELKRKGIFCTRDRIVRLEDVTEPREGSVFALVMDTGPCLGAIALAKDADLLVMEATYASGHEELARLYLHATAGDAARTAQRAGSRRLALSHFSQRYPDAAQHLEEAEAIFPNVIALNDLDRVEIPRRR
jgi:ribonuclease Z